MAAGEQDAEQLRLRARSLTDALWEAMQRGDMVTVMFGSRDLSGRLRAARNDLAVLDMPDGGAAVNVASAVAVRFTRGEGGVTGERTYGSFRAYLGMLEVEGRTVALLGRRTEVRGVVAAVSADHVLLRASPGVEWAFPLGEIDAVLDGGL